MQVILLEKVANLGNLGDKVNVKPGYGRNFLVPQGKATAATPANIAEFEQRRAEYEAKANQQLAGAEARQAQLADVGGVDLRELGEACLGVVEAVAGPVDRGACVGADER